MLLQLWKFLLEQVSEDEDELMVEREFLLVKAFKTTFKVLYPSFPLVHLRDGYKQPECIFFIPTVKNEKEGDDEIDRLSVSNIFVVHCKRAETTSQNLLANLTMTALTEELVMAEGSIDVEVNLDKFIVRRINAIRLLEEILKEARHF